MHSFPQPQELISVRAKRACKFLVINSFLTELKKQKQNDDLDGGWKMKKIHSATMHNFFLILNVYVAQSIKYYTSNESLYNSLQFHGILRERKGNNKERILWKYTQSIKNRILLFYFHQSFTFFLLNKHFYSKKFRLVSRITFLCILDKKKLIPNIISTRIGWEN